ncbi:MAG TPA: site-specific integrase [Nitrososphaerales archaeon]|nr:site-specific integrase [Nitrososphaerales archaeon]
MNWQARDEFLSKVYRRSKSEHSKRFYGFGIKSFQEFCETNKVKSIGKKNVYTILDSYVHWLDKKGIRPKTFSDYVSAVRKYLSHIDIEIQPTTFKSKVTMPKITKIDDKPLSIVELRQVIAKGRPNNRMRALIYTLISSGMRIGEALSVKVGDVNLKDTPATIAVKAEYSKTRTGRVAYISDEAKEALKEIFDKETPKDRLLFDYAGDLWQREKVVMRTFREVVERAGLNELIDNHRIHKIHFHNFRKYFLTKGTDKIGEHAAHANSNSFRR